MKFLVVFEEAAGPETWLVSSRENALSEIDRIRDEYGLNDEDMEECTKVYTVTEVFDYVTPKTKAGLVSNRKF